VRLAAVLFAFCALGAIGMPPAVSASAFASPDTYGKIINLGAELGGGDLRLALEECNEEKTNCRFGDGSGISCLVSGAPHRIDAVVCLLGDRDRARQFLRLADLTMIMFSPDAAEEEREVTFERLGNDARTNDSHTGEARLYGVRYSLGVGGVFTSFTAETTPK